MSLLTVSDSDLATFLRVAEHHFDSTPDSQWSEMAVAAARESALLIREAGNHLTVLEILEIIGNRRQRFANTHGHTPVEEFGKFRDGAYELTIEEAGEKFSRLHAAHDRLKARTDTPPELTVSFDSCTTLCRPDDPLLPQFMSNLEQLKPGDDGVVVAESLPEGTDKMMNLVVRKRLTVSPDSFFDVARYRCTGLCSPGSTTPLTSFYLPTNVNLTFLMIEHPVPGIVVPMLKGQVQSLYERVIQGRDLASVGSLIWYCHHLVPFKRGSAAVLLIFTAGLLLALGLPIHHYGPVRLDVDAMSMVHDAFVERFVERMSA